MSTIIIILIIVVVAAIAVAVVWKKIDDFQESIKESLLDPIKEAVSSLDEALSQFDKKLKSELKLELPPDITETIKGLGIIMPLLKVNKWAVGKRLAEAARNNDVGMLNKFCNKKGLNIVHDINMPVDYDTNDTAAIVAARARSEKFMLALKSREADFDKQNEAGKSANSIIAETVLEAAGDGNVKELDRLRDIGLLGDVNIHKKDDTTNIGHVSVEIGNDDMLRWFLEHGGRTDIPGRIGDREDVTVDDFLTADQKVQLKQTLDGMRAAGQAKAETKQPDDEAAETGTETDEKTTTTKETVQEDVVIEST